MILNTQNKSFVLPSLLIGAAVSALGMPLARAQDKWHYTLFNPTLRQQMRPMSTDRPDITESPYTVDAGHVQAEFSFVDYTDDSEDGVDVDSTVVMPLNLKVGLLNNVDLQLVVDPYVTERTRAGGESDREDGFGDTQIRVKINAWGNDGEGSTAFALMPFVKFPTADDELGNDHVEGGLIVPLAVALPAEFGLGLMAEIDIVRNADDDGYAVEFVHSATIGHTLVGDLAGYIEYVGVAPHNSGSTYRASAGTGLTYALSEDVQLDAGVNIGLSDAADDLNIFTGLSVRR